MNKILIIGILILSSIGVFPQAPTYRTSPAVNVFDYKLGAVNSFKLPVGDTTQLTAGTDSLGAITYRKADSSVYIRVPASGSTRKWVKLLKVGEAISSVSWGQILGNLSNQTDLQAALNLKLSNITSLITAGSNITITGSGTAISPYVINGSPGGGSGTVTTVSIVSANGISGSVANATTTPAITLTLGNITPTTVNASGTVTASNISGTTSGTNTGDQTTITGNAGSASVLQTGRTISITGDLAYTSPIFNGSANVTAAGTLSATGVSPGSYTNTNITVDAKGRITSASNGSGGGGGSGTVTSVATNNGSGITGGTITGSGTLVADTVNVLSTKWYRQKGIDSVVSLINALPVITASNGLTKTGNDITLGGTITTNKAITGNGTYTRNFQFSNLNSFEVSSNFFNGNFNNGLAFVGPSSQFVMSNGYLSFQAGDSIRLDATKVILDKLRNGSADTVLSTNSNGDIIKIYKPSGGGGTPSLTSTYVGYGSGSNLLTGTNNFVWDNTNSILNIGNATSSSNGGIVVGGSGTGVGTITGGGGSLNIVGGNLTLESNATHYISIKTNTTERLRILNDGTWNLAGDPGTSGQVLTSNGNGAVPTWEDGGGLNTGFRLFLSATPPTDTTVVWVDTSPANRIDSLNPIRRRIPGKWEDISPNSGWYYDPVFQTISAGPLYKMLIWGQSNAGGPATVNDGYYGDTTIDSRVTMLSETTGLFEVVTAHMTDDAYVGFRGANSSWLLAKRIAKETGRSVRMVYDVRGGTCIDEWAGNATGVPDTAVGFLRIRAKTALAGIHTYDLIIQSNGECGTVIGNDYYVKDTQLIAAFRRYELLDSTGPYLAQAIGDSVRSYSYNGGDNFIRKLAYDADRYTDYIDVTDYANKGGIYALDYIHFNARGMEGIYRKMWTALQNNPISVMDRMVGYGQSAAPYNLIATSDSNNIITQGLNFKNTSNHVYIGMGLYPFYGDPSPNVSGQFGAGLLFTGAADNTVMLNGYDAIYFRSRSNGAWESNGDIKAVSFGGTLGSAQGILQFFGSQAHISAGSGDERTIFITPGQVTVNRNGAAANASAAFEVGAAAGGGTYRGWLPPKFSLADTASLIASPIEGLQFFDIIGHVPQFYDGISWKAPLTPAPTATVTSLLSRGYLYSPHLPTGTNNVVMSGLDINPDFQTGIYTGCDSFALRLLSGKLYVGQVPDGSGTDSVLVILGGVVKKIARTSFAGVTNLSYTASPTNGLVNSSTGSSATLTLATLTNAGLMSPANFGYVDSSRLGLNAGKVGGSIINTPNGSGVDSLHLDGDAVAPGNKQFYGTSSTGVKGFFARPYGGQAGSTGVVGSNVSAVGATSIVYTVTDSTVTGSGTVAGVTTTLPSTFSTLYIPLPVASAFDATVSCFGVLSAPTNLIAGGEVTQDATNDRLQLNFYTVTAFSSYSISFTFSYRIK